MRDLAVCARDSERKMEKATTGTADIVLLDLEDAVADGATPKARSMVSAFLTANAPQRAALGQNQSASGFPCAGRSRGGGP
jgi:citrate lyase beta subunit